MRPNARKTLIGVLLLALAGCELGSLAAAGPGEAAHEKLHDWGLLPNGDGCGCMGLTPWRYHHPRVSNIGKLVTLIAAITAFACGDLLRGMTAAGLARWIGAWVGLAVLGMIVGIALAWGPEPVHKFLHTQRVFLISNCMPVKGMEMHWAQDHPLMSAIGWFMAIAGAGLAGTCLWLRKRLLNIDRASQWLPAKVC